MTTAAPPGTEIPLVVRLQMEAAGRLGLTARVLDPEFGYLFEVSDGKRNVTLLGGRSPLNDAVAARLCEDKFYAALILARAGYSVPESVRCLDPDYFQLDSYRGRTGTAPGLAFAREHGYPVVVKPNRMSHGRHVALVGSEQELQAQVRRIWSFDYLALVQSFVAGVDLRFDFLDGEYLAGYLRRPLVLRGDGRRSLRELLVKADIRFEDREVVRALERDAAWHGRVRARGRTAESVLPAGETIDLGGGILNLNRGATAEVVTDLPEVWRDFCLGIGRALGLRHFGVDLRAAGLDGGPRDAVVIEVNSSPLLVQLHRMGHEELALRGHMRVLEAVFAAPARPLRAGTPERGDS